MKRPSAIRRYKLAARKIKRDRAAGGILQRPVAVVSAPSPRRIPSGEWVVSADGQRLAGPFDTRDEAQQWIDEQ